MREMQIYDIIPSGQNFPFDFLYESKKGKHPKIKDIKINGRSICGGSSNNVQESNNNDSNNNNQQETTNYKPTEIVKRDSSPIKMDNPTVIKGKDVDMDKVNSMSFMTSWCDQVDCI